MKKGKSVKLNLFQPIKTVYGTVDSKNLKSLYINIQSWVNPKFEHNNWNRVVCNLSRDIKHSVFDSIDTNLFKEKSIVDLDLRTSKEIDFKSQDIKDSVRKIVNHIFYFNVENNKYFEFSTSKK
jgi:hypothetical protein